MFDGDSPLHKRHTVPMADRGTVLNIVSWMLLAVVVCTLIVRFATKLAIKSRERRLGWDDVFVAFAALFSFGQTIAISIEATKVLGQHVQHLSVNHKLTYQKAEYAACMLYIASMGCARISVCLLINKVLPGRIPRYSALAFAVFTALWTISGVLVTAFACNVPRPWKFVENPHCIDVVAFINYIGITNIVVEVLLVLIPLIVWNVRLSTGRRVSVSLVFLARLTVVAAVSAQLYFFNLSTLHDFSYDSWAAVLCQQVAQNLAVISACLPCLHPFILSILAGRTQPETISFKNGAPPCIRQYLDQRTSTFDPTASQDSQSSERPLTEKLEPYCRPLATHGLIHSSRHHQSASSVSFPRFPANTAKPIFTPRAPENIFNRLVEVPRSLQWPSTSAKDPLLDPKDLSSVGILPVIDWDIESNNSRGSRRRSPTRQLTAEYVFNREKVISVPEERHLYDDESKQFAPPLPSPKLPKRPPRAF